MLNSLEVAARLAVASPRICFLRQHSLVIIFCLSFFEIVLFLSSRHFPISEPGPARGCVILNCTQIPLSPGPGKDIQLIWITINNFITRSWPCYTRIRKQDWLMRLIWALSVTVWKRNVAAKSMIGIYKKFVASFVAKRLSLCLS